MRRRASPTRIGLFAIGAVALLVAAVVVVSRGGLFAARERAVMHFEGSIYGLQLGAPVVFRGVRLGSVMSIGVVHDGSASRFAIPVEVELDRGLIRSPDGKPDGPTLAALVAQGLTAQLATQSLLTGLLYVDLDLRPGAATRPQAAPHGSVVEIPTLATPIQSLQKQLQRLDVAKLVDDVSAIAASARQLVADPNLRQSLADLAAASGQLQRLMSRLEQRIDPLADALQGTLTQTRQTMAQWQGTGDRVGAAVDRAASAVARTEALLAEGTPVLRSAQRAADELARSAVALRAVMAEDSPLITQVQRAAQDVSRASRAVRELADLLETQPEALIRGRSPAGP